MEASVSCFTERMCKTLSLFDRIIDGMLKDKVSLRHRRHIIVFVAIITLLSMVSSTLAWFSVNTFVGVDTLNLHISLAPQLKVAMHDYGTDLSRYTKVITNDMINEYLAGYDTTLDDIILDPVTTTAGVEMTNRTGTVREPNKRTYLEFECYFIATEDMWVHLTSENVLDEMDSGTKCTTTETGAKADVINCMRVSFADNDRSASIYEPNRGTPVNGQSTFDVSTPMNYSDGTRLFHLRQLTPTKITMRFWIEGNDPQCDDDVQDAQVTIQLAFVGTDDSNIPMS